jgi:hypothetical protein
MIEGQRNETAETRDAVSRRRLTALAEAVRAHESENRIRPYRRRPQDDHLYRRVRQILGS